MERFRDLSEKDRDAIEEMLEESKMFSEEEVKVALELVDASLKDTNQQDYLFICAADDNDDILAYACYGLNTMCDRTYDLYWICVSPKHQGKGIGSVLLKETESRIAAAGARMLIAETSSTDMYLGTRKFYEKRGYAEVARVPDYYKEGDDMVIYQKRFDRR